MTSATENFKAREAQGASKHPISEAKQEMGTPASRHALDDDPPARKLEQSANKRAISHQGKDSSSRGSVIAKPRRDRT